MPTRIRATGLVLLVVLAMLGASLAPPATLELPGTGPPAF